MHFTFQIDIRGASEGVEDEQIYENDIQSYDVVSAFCFFDGIISTG